MLNLTYADTSPFIDLIVRFIERLYGVGNLLDSRWRSMGLEPIWKVHFLAFVACKPYFLRVLAV